MEKRKIYGTLIGIIAFVFLIIGVTYAYFGWVSNSSENTNINLTVSDKKLKNFINYKQGESIIDTSGGSLVPGYSYNEGVSTTIEFWKNKNYNNPIYGSIELEILDLLPKTGTGSTNISQTETIKWAITSYSCENDYTYDEETNSYSCNSIVEEEFDPHIQGNFINKNKGDKWSIYQDFELNEYPTFYKIYIWFDISAINKELSVEGELLSTKISASATDEQGIYSMFANEAIVMLSDLSNCESGASGVCPTNAYTDDTTTLLNDEQNITKYHEYRYVGANVDNYVSFNNDMYRIIGVFDEESHGVENEMLVKLISANPLTTIASDGFNTQSKLYQILNNHFFNYNSSSSYNECHALIGSSGDKIFNNCSYMFGYSIKNDNIRKYIQNATWFTSGSSSLGHNIKYFYDCERNYENCSSIIIDGTGSVNANIGLMYLSDYLYTSTYYSGNVYSGQSDISMNNWLFKGAENTITPVDINSSKIYMISNNGIVSSNVSDGKVFILIVRPVLYLKSNVKIIDGAGTFDKPFILSCDDCI